jgi:DNA-3-methyladenine glycosylase
LLDPSQRADVRRITRAFFARPCDSVAQELLGTLLLVNGVGGPIIETEGYDGDDPASHSYPMRRTERNAVMFGPPGHAYVYRSYGIHWCLNFVCETGSAVLVRALVPEHGIDVMQRRRGMENVRRLCAGPGRLCQALDVTGDLNGASLFEGPFSLGSQPPTGEILAGPRIGISKAKDRQRRFGVHGSLFLSRPF